MNNRVPAYLGLLAAIAMLSVTLAAMFTNITIKNGSTTVTAGATIPLVILGAGYAVVVLLMGIYRIMGGRVGAILSGYGLMMVPLLIVWLNVISRVQLGDIVPPEMQAANVGVAVVPLLAAGILAWVGMPSA